VWQREHGYPFRFNTEASVDLANDPELMELMVDCYFDTVFLGIETPDEESLTLTKKFQNTRGSLLDSVETIIQAGLRPMAGFIIGFDGEDSGAGERIVRFAEAAAIPTTTFAMLQALPHTALWHRLQREGRLLDASKGNINQTTLMNFVPTRPMEEIAQEYIEAFWRLYDPHLYLDRNYRCFRKLAPPRCRPSAKLPSFTDLKALAIVLWRQGIKRDTRWRFWRHLAGILRHNPGVAEHYLTLCAHQEHFLAYREIVRREIQQQVDEYLAQRREEEEKVPAALSR
jgi:radical SAM superfamily enzyme YgiQ (UPF0313 family)